MSQLAVGGAENKSGAKNTLKTVVTTMWEDLKSKPGKPCGYMLVCQGKASTVLACGHPQCYCLYWDSHVYRPNKPEYSASLLFSSEKALLAHMCSEDLYQEEASCHLYAFQQSDVDMQVCGIGNPNPTTPCPLCTEHASSLKHHKPRQSSTCQSYMFCACQSCSWCLDNRQYRRDGVG